MCLAVACMAGLQNTTISQKRFKKYMKTHNCQIPVPSINVCVCTLSHTLIFLKRVYLYLLINYITSIILHVAHVINIIVYCHADVTPLCPQ